MIFYLQNYYDDVEMGNNASEEITYLVIKLALSNSLYILVLYHTKAISITF